MTPETATLVNLADITEIELIILRRMREVTLGDHRSHSQGPGFDYVGTRDWQPGDRFANIDWAQSSLSDFSQLVVREFAQPSTATVIAVADRSLSTRCGVGGVTIAASAAHAIATIGLSAVFFQDLFGLMTFDAGLRDVCVVRPRIGRNQVIHCLDAYEHQRGLQDVKYVESLSTTIASFVRRTAMVPFISDFLVDDPRAVLKELALLSSSHDAFVVLLDAAYAYELPRLSAGWIEIHDVETGRARVVSRREAMKMSDRIRLWQDDVAVMARDFDLDVIRLGTEPGKSDLALAEFVSERRLRKVI